MLSHIFDMNDEEYSKLNIQAKIGSEIISAKANAKFSSTVSHILSDRNRGKDEFDKNDAFRIRCMNADIEAAVYLEGVLKRILKSEYGEMPQDLEEQMNEIANEYAEIALEKFGWRKDNGKDKENNA